MAVKFSSTGYLYFFFRQKNCHLPLDDAVTGSLPEDGAEEGDVAEEEMNASATTEETLGRTFDDDTGRVVSSRVKKPTKQSEDFVYK